MLERLCHHTDYSLKHLYGPELSLAFEFEYVLKKVPCNLDTQPLTSDLQLMKSFLPKLYKTVKRADAKLEMMVPFGSVNGDSIGEKVSVFIIRGFSFRSQVGNLVMVNFASALCGTKTTSRYSISELRTSRYGFGISSSTKGTRCFTAWPCSS